MLSRFSIHFLLVDFPSLITIFNNLVFSLITLKKKKKKKKKMKSLGFKNIDKEIWKLITKNPNHNFISKINLILNSMQTRRIWVYFMYFYFFSELNKHLRKYITLCYFIFSIQNYNISIERFCCCCCFWFIFFLCNNLITKEQNINKK